MSIAAGFRRATGADREAILALRGRLFPNVDPEKRSASYWDWSFRDSYAGEAFVFVAEAGNRVVGHLAFIPQRYSTPAGLADGVLAVDAMVDPEFQRRHVFSALARFAADQLRKEVAFSIALQIRQASLGGMLAGGWSVAERVPVLLKMPSLTGFVSGRRAAMIETGPSPVRDLTASALSAQFPADANAQPRTAAFNDWRFTRRPGSRYSCHGWFERDVLQAFVVHRPARLKGVATLAVVDAGVQPGADDALVALLRHVCARHRNGATVVATLLSAGHPARKAMRASSFFRSPYAFNLLVQVFDRRFEVAATAPWQLSWADTDHL